VTALETRLARVEATLAIRELLSRCCRTIDGSDAEAWLDCFTVDARWTSMGSDGRVSFELRGREALWDWFSDFRGRVPLNTQVHLTVNESITGAGRDWGSTSTFFTSRIVGDAPPTTSTGTYTDSIVQCDDGVWRISERLSRRSPSSHDSGSSRPVGGVNRQGARVADDGVSA
jgi:hypothetical protein